jgi:nitrate reductase (NAD(P)H)
VQVYRANEHPRFPAGGKMSQHLDALPIGAEIEVKGPLGHFHYLGRSRHAHFRPRMFGLSLLP